MMRGLAFSKPDSFLRRLVGRLSDDTAQSLIEVYVVLPIMMFILVGAVEMARVGYASIEVMNAASAGVQYGAQNPVTAMDSAGILVAAQKDAANITVTLSAGSPTRSCVCSNNPSAPPPFCATTGTACPGSNPETILTVTTQTSFNPGFHLSGFPTSFTLQGTAVQKVMQ
jgi:hypothetical protein